VESNNLSLRTDVALNIHFQTISGVKLFHGCNPGLIKMIGRRIALDGWLVNRLYSRTAKLVDGQNRQEQRTLSGTWSLCRQFNT
jgi:hypothetical protein